MNASRNTKLGALAVLATALVAAGAAFAAGQHNGSKAPTASGLLTGSYVSSATGHTGRGPGPGRGPGDDFAAAATYLGLTQTELQTALQSGKTLAQVANTTDGKSQAGLIDALVAAEKTELAAAVTAGNLTQAQADQMTPTLKARFTDFVNGVRPDHGGFGRHGGAGGPGGGLAAAATYLGLTDTALRTQLEAGKTLAQVANATAGKSAAGLIDALVAAEKKELAAAVTAGRLTQAQADQIATNLDSRVTGLVNGARPDHDGFGGHDGPPPAGAPAPPSGTAPSGTHL